MSFDKITTRISRLSYGLDTKWVDASKVAQKVSPACLGLEMTSEAEATAGIVVSTTAFMATASAWLMVLSAIG